MWMWPIRVTGQYCKLSRLYIAGFFLFFNFQFLWVYNNRLWDKFADWRLYAAVAQCSFMCLISLRNTVRQDFSVRAHCIEPDGVHSGVCSSARAEWIYCFLPGAHNKLIPRQVKGELGVISHAGVGKSGDPRTEGWDTQREKYQTGTPACAEVFAERTQLCKQTGHAERRWFIHSEQRVEESTGCCLRGKYS